MSTADCSCQLKLGMATANLLASNYIFDFRLTVL
ncbi:hypothetical protein T01_6053 [Trichinella spiralis]|uniref:Uncharacterized protein n=1 Tax=Trichinella spiralis TaxID=6334 RepID=A0A0V1AI44_TRISP|nr:hypothetical protein T01_6053 [Trichinella spiralis]